jgi:parallel beta-helix repeat protein
MKKQYIVVPIVMLAMLIALSIPTSALNGPVPLGYNKIVDSVPHGDYTIRWTPNPSPYTFSVPDKELYWVGIYDSVWMPSDPIHATYNGHTLPDSSPSTSTNTRHTGCGTCGVWFDNETGNTTQGASNTYHSWNINNAHGTGVPIVYIEPDNPNTLYYWFYQGYDDSEGYLGCDGYSFCMDYTFTGVDKDVATDWTLMVAVTCADDGNVVFNGNALPNGYDMSTKFYHVAINDVTGMVQDGDNTVRLRTDDEYFHPFWMWLVGETPGGVSKPDLKVTDIDAGTPRPEHNSTVNATILNQGDADAGAFNVGLFINGSLNDTVRVEAGLPAGDSIPVSLTTAKLPENCYEFKVVADSDGEIPESDESNNATWKDHQVGYVIVVRSDSDFAKLKQECDEEKLPTGSVTYDGSTYYIQDLTITNCAGEGILIVDTSKNFVINNCTIKNCKPAASGVFLNNITKGTITGSTLQDNTAYGIELGLVPLSSSEDHPDPEFINITNNEFYHNKNGIDLIGFNCIVKDNLVQDSTEYGIYVYANDSKIYNNTIENNVDYGMKLYNSSGNCIYGNTLINNKGGAVQGYDNRNNNNWNSTVELCYYNDTSVCCTNYIGNNWSDYPGSDNDNDKIGDAAYGIDGGAGAKDYSPLMEPWVNYARVLCGDVNGDTLVNIGDGKKAAKLEIDTCDWAADVDCNHLINIGDGKKIAKLELNCCDPCCAG